MPQLQGRFIVAKMTRYQLSKLSHSRLFPKEDGLLSAANVENTLVIMKTHININYIFLIPPIP